MSAREPRFEVVRTDAGWHARFVAANGQTVWTTESYKRRRNAIHAVDLFERAVDSRRAVDYREVDERGPRIAPTSPYTLTSASSVFVANPDTSTIWNRA